MAPISLKIISNEGAVTRKFQFDTKSTIRDAHALLKEKVIVPDQTKEHGLFLRSLDDDCSGIWLENHRTLDYYMLRDGDSLEYICKIRNLRIKLLDGTVKTIQVNEGKTISELMVSICGRLNIANHDEHGLCPEEEEPTEDVKDPPQTGTLTLKRRKAQPRERDVALEELSKKINTDDNVHWLDQHSTLRELGVLPSATLVLKRRLFFSDRNVDARDPVQLTLLYAQTRDAILGGHHLVTEDQAVEFAGIQCQIHYEDFQEEKHKPGFIENLNEFLPVTYSSSWGIEKKVLRAYRKHTGLSPLEAKNLYIKTARDLPTYGVTFFLVKEKQKGKKKLVPRLLGINAQAILRMDEVTKEILQQWPLTHVKNYHVGKAETFTLNFGDYSDKEYCCKTQDVHRIREILEGYIDLIRRRMLAKPSGDIGDSMAICHDMVEAGQSNLIQHVQNQPNKLISETFVGPSRILTHDQGSTAQCGTQVMTMQQIIASNQFNNPQRAMKGEVAQRGDMSIDCVRKLKRMNSCSVKIVTLLAEPTEANIVDTRQLTKNMQDDLVVVETGVQAVVQQQTIEESRQMLMNEMQDLNNYVNKLSDAVEPGQVNPNEAKDAAEKIVDLTTEMYFAQDPKTRRRSELLNRSKKSFIAGEKMDENIRRASFLTAASSTIGGLDRAAATLAQEYRGPPPDEARARHAELALQDRLGKLNAALALYLTAHSDPNNIDYPAAINSMNTIDELLSDLAKEGQLLASTKTPEDGKELLDDLRALIDKTRNLCSLTGVDDHAKMQEASSRYGDVAGKLIFKIFRGGNLQKENEIIELAKVAGDKTTLLLMSTNELTGQAPAECAAVLDTAGVKSAAAAMDLLACAQLTAPAIYEPHCRSALTAAVEGLSSSVHHLSATWKPLVEDPGRQQLSEQLHHREMDVHLALEKLKDAYANLGDLEDESVPLEERQRLKFILSMSGARDNLKGLANNWGKPGVESPPSSPGPKGVMMQELKEKAAARRLAQQLAELNGAVARLANATADPKQQDYETAASALNTIAELMPTIVQDADVVSARQDEGTRAAMKQHVTKLCEASQHLVENLSSLDDLGPPAAKFAGACSKLVFLISPGADKGKEKTINDLATAAYQSSSALLAQAHGHADELGKDAADLRAAAARAEQAARALVTVAQVTAPSVNEASCSSALASAVQHLHNCTNEVTAKCYPHLKPDSAQFKELQKSHNQLENNLERLAQVCGLNLNDQDVEMGEPSELDTALSPQQEKRRLQFIKSMSDAKTRLDEAEQQMKEPLACVMMRAEDAAALQRQLAERLARLNAAVAALARATSDEKNPDYEAAQQAVDTITEVMPELVQETCVLGATKSSDTQHNMLRQLQRLCRATQALCDSAPDAKGVNEATAEFSDASGKLVFLVSPGADHGKENEIKALTSDACGRASELLSHVQDLIQKVPEEAGAELDKRRARTTDDAQVLLTTAQVKAPTIASPHCSAALVSAAEQLRGSAKDLTGACQPHLKAGHQDQQGLENSAQQLENSLDKLVQACKEAPRRKPPPPPQQDKQRLHFVNSLSGAKSCFDDTQQLLNEPVVCAMMREEDAVALEHKLADRLAQLNAAIAALSIATADREHPDYASAQRAVSTITALMPELVRESRTLCGTRTNDGQQEMLRQVQQLCDASRAVCDSAQQPQALNEAAAKFSNASGKLMFTLTPGQGRDKQLEQQGPEQLELQASSEKPRRKPPAPPKQDKQRLHFVNSLSGAKSCFDDAQQLLKEPVVCAMMREEDGVALEHKLADRLAQLNAAIAALATATADREHPDYASAQRAINTITTLMPELVRDSKTLCGTKTDDAQQNLLRQVQQLCDASRAVCDSTQQPQALNDAATKFSDASGKLMFTFSPAPVQGKEKQIMDLSAESYNHAAELMSQAQVLQDQLHPDVTSHLDSCCSRTGDAAQALLAVAQVTAPSMSSPHCQAALDSAVQKLRGSAAELTSACDPHLKQGPQRQHLLDTHQHLDDSLDKLLHESGVPVVLSPEQQEKRRLTFINSLSGAKSCFGNVEKQLKQPVVSSALQPEEQRALQLRLSDRLAQLNAAIAKLTAATADREHPDYASARRAVTTITALMPELVQDAKTLSGTQQGPAQQSMLQQVQQLCDASRAVCDSAQQPQDLNEAAVKFSEAFSELTSKVAPGATHGTQLQILELSTASAGNASELLSQVQALTQHIDGPAATDLYRRRARTGDAAQALLSVALVTAPSISSPQCKAALESAVHKLRGSAADLTGACDPHVKQGPQRQQLLDTHQKLDDSLDMLLEASGIPVVLAPEQQEKRRLTFINSLSGAKSCFRDVEKQLKQPVLSSTLQPEEQRALQLRLSDRLVQLNAAIAKLTAATADREQPDYASARRAISTITALMPELVQDAKTLSGTQQGPAQQSMLRQVQQLCDASRAVCDSTESPQGLSEAAVKFSEASSQLTSSVAPGATQGTQQQIIDLSAASAGCTSELLSQVQALTQQIDGPAATDLDRRGARTADAAQALLSVAQVTAPSISSPQCKAALESAVHKLRGSAADLTGACDPHVKQGPQRQQLLDTHQNLDDSLDMLLEASGVPVVLAPEQQEKRRQTFINSLSGAKSCFSDVEKQFKQPVLSSTLQPEEQRALQLRLSDRLAQLNAAIAKLTAATADREHPDYASARRAVTTITALMPELVRDAKTLSATQQGPAQQNMLRQVQQLCDASRDVCDSTESPQGLSEAAVKFSEASSKLTSSVGPGATQGTQQQIIDLSAASVGRASELLSQVQALTQQIDGPAATDLDRRGARTADAAQALLSVAQVTAPSISSPQCKAVLESAVHKLRGSAADLTGACDPHVKQGPQRQQLLDTHQKLDDSLDMLLEASGVPVVLAPEQQEKRRLNFINSLSGAKSCFSDVEKQLKQPVVSSALQPEEQRALQLRLSDRLAQLNAAIAKLTAATADREHPDYASAQRAVTTITALMPELVRDAKTLSATQQGPAQQNMLRQVQQLCDASRDVCDSTESPQGLSEAAVKFSEASSKLTSSVGPGATQGTQQQIIDLSAASVGRASELLSQVQALTQQIDGPAATDLDRRGTRTADAAQALLSVAQVTAPSISSPQCKAVLESAVHKLRGSATDLTGACDPHVKQGPQRQQLLDTHQKLDDSLDMLLEASGVPVVLAPEQQEKRRQTFINSLSGAKSCFSDVEKQLKQPVLSSTLQPEEQRALQLRLSDRLAQLNAAIAKLTAATADREHPDYASARRAVTTITALMPELVRDAKTLSATQQGPAQQNMLRQVQQLCDASRDVCDSTESTQGLSEAAVKFSEASSKLTSSVGPGATQGTQQQIIDLSAASVGRASELLSQVQALTQQIDGPAATDLDRRGARTADAAQALLSVAQVTAPSISSPQCKAALESAVHKLRGSAADLTGACDPHVKQGPQRQQLLDTHQKLDDSLDMLLEASGVPVVLAPEQQEKRSLTFINSLSGAKSCFSDVEKQLKQPVVSSALQPEEQRALQLRLSDRLAQLNAAIAKLTAATADREHPDYASAQRAVTTITALMPELVRDAKTLCGTQQGPAQQNMLRQVQQLCDASRDVCDSTESPQGLSEAAVKFSEASNKLTSSVGPGATQGTQQQIIDLSAASVGRASKLLSQVQALTQQIDGPAATDLDRRGARTADAAQALLSVAQVTAPSMRSPHCRKALVSAVQKLRGSAADLTGACDPHVKQDPQRQQLLDTHQNLDDSLDMLLEASGVPVVLSPEQQEKRRLTFINSLAGAKSCFTDVQQQLKQPVVSSTLPQEEARSLQRQLTDRLARLNAAVASLAAATADREHPDYASAQRAVTTITALMPELVRDAKTLSATQQGPAQQSLLRQVQQLCDASKAVCDSMESPQGLGETAMKFSEASNKLTSSVTPVGATLVKGGRQERQQQIIELSAKSCVCASELLGQVQELTQQIEGPAATDLDRRGARTADAAQALLTVAQVTAPSIRSPHCRKPLETAVQRLRGSAADLTGACDPYVKQGPQRQKLLDTHQNLDDNLDLLLLASGARLSPEQQEKQRQNFITNLSEAKNCFADVQQQLKQPVAPSTLQPEELRALQFRLSDKLAQLNAAIAKLTVATADREHPDYASAQRAITTITALMPELVRDAKTLSGTQQGPAQQSMLQQVQQLCDASRAVCNSAQQPQELNKVATHFSEASSHLMSAVSPVDDHGKDKLIMDLSEASCSRAFELVAQAQSKRGQLRADVSAQLDACGARTDDAAQTLKAVVQVTAPSISSPECQVALESAVQALRDSAGELAGTCNPHLKPGLEQQQVLDAHRHLDDSLDLLLQASASGDERSPALQEALRMKFIRCVSAISPHVKDAEKLLNEPGPSASQTQAQAAALQHQLGRRLGHLNEAVAALTSATSDHKYPDYAAAERSIITITELMPKVVQESKTLSCTKSDDSQQMIRQNLKELCDASRRIVDNADDPKKLNESSVKFAFASGKLMLLVAPDYGEGGKRKGPAVPPRASSNPDGHSTKPVAHAVPSRNSIISQDFLNAMRAEEDNEIAARVVAAEKKWGVSSQTDEEKCRRRQFSDTVDTVEDEIKYVEGIIKKLRSAAPGAVDALELVRVEQRAEEALARAGVDVAALVAANYADKLDYSAAQEPTLALGRTLRAIVEDGSAISGALPEESRKPFIKDMSGLCGATRILCQAARDDKDRLNDAAIAFGNHSARLLQVVSAHVNPAQEKEVIHRARAIGDCASRLAQEATTVANNSANMLDSKSGEHVQTICTACAQCVDAAGKLVYTAKLVAPTIHHKTCQEALTSSADTLSSNLKTFSDTWQPFASDPRTQKLTEESRNLARLLATLKADVRRGRLGKRREVDRPVVVDTPLRQMTIQIIDNARNMAEHGDLPPEAKEEYRKYSGKLTEAVRALDYSNARCQRAPHDKNRRNEMEIAIQDLQMMLLQARPARAGQEQNNIVDFRDFLQGLVTESDNLARTVEKHKAITGNRTADDIKLLCSKISEDSTKLMNPSQNAAYDGFDDMMEIDEFGQECDVLVRELNSLIRSVPEQKARSELLARLFPLTENCNLLRFASSSALSTAEAAAHDAALQDLDDFHATLLRALQQHRPRDRTEEEIPRSGGAGAWRVLRAALALSAAAGRPPALRRALTSYALRARAARRPHAAVALRRLAQPEFVCEEQVISTKASETAEAAIGDNLNILRQKLTNVSYFASPDECSASKRDKMEPQGRCLTQKEVEQLMCSSQEIEDTDDKSEELAVFQHLEAIAREVQESTETSALLAANWLKPDSSASANLIRKVSWNIQEMSKEPNAVKSKPEVEVLKEEDIEKLLSCHSQKVEGTRSQLEARLAQLSTKLSSMSGSVFQSVRTPSSAARSLHAAASAAGELAAAARALKDDKKPAQSKRIEDAVHEMCLATFSLMKISELLCQYPDHHDTRRRLLDACYHLNDSINKLNRTIHPEPSIARECHELLGVLQLQRSVLQSAPQPAASSPYAHCIEALQSQREVLLKLNSDEAMSREEFLKSMLYITTAVTNSTECAAQAAYLLSVSEKDSTVAVDGLVDVPKMQKTISAIHDTCVSVTMNPIDQVIEEKRVLEKQMEELLKDLDESVKKTKDQKLKTTLVMCKKEIEGSAKAFYKVVNEKKPSDALISAVLTLDDDVTQLSGALEHPALVPAGAPSAANQALCDDVLRHSTTLVSDTQELIKDIKTSSERSEVMKWSSFAKRKEVLSAIDALIKSIKTNGQNVNIIEADNDDTEHKSYVQIQTDTAFKWLHKPMAKSDVKANGQQAVKNLIDIGKKMAEELSGADREDLRHAVDEAEQLLAHCSRKYDQDQYSLLMERIRELQKAIERMAVTRVVEDFMDAEEPLADLDILADAERDEKKRKFLLEQKIAELLAQLGRVKRTASFIADTGSNGAKVSTELRTCSEQTELLAPLLVKAAEERIHKSDNQMAIDNYRALLAQYTAALAKVRDLCDQSVDPMDFVQTAGETMQRMRDEANSQDVMKCAYTSAAITKLAHRVVHVGLSSSSARADPELQRALVGAQRQLSAATPAPDTRASRMPDWKDTTALILRATGEVESVLGGENIFNKQPDTNEPIYNEALNLHVAIRDWSSRDNEIVAVARRMAVLMAKLSAYMHADKQREVLSTSKNIVLESREVARLARKLAHECPDQRIKTNLLQVCDRIPTISGQLKMLTTIKGSSLGHHGTQEDKEAMDMLVGNAQSLMISIQDVVKAAASASVKIMSQRGPRIKWVRRTYY